MINKKITLGILLGGLATSFAPNAMAMYCEIACEQATQAIWDGYSSINSALSSSEQAISQAYTQSSGNIANGVKGAIEVQTKTLINALDGLNSSLATEIRTVPTMEQVQKAAEDYHTQPTGACTNEAAASALGTAHTQLSTIGTAVTRNIQAYTSSSDKAYSKSVITSGADVASAEAQVSQLLAQSASTSAGVDSTGKFDATLLMDPQYLELEDQQVQNVDTMIALTTDMGRQGLILDAQSSAQDHHNVGVLQARIAKQTIGQVLSMLANNRKKVVTTPDPLKEMAAAINQTTGATISNERMMDIIVQYITTSPVWRAEVNTSDDVAQQHLTEAQAYINWINTQTFYINKANNVLSALRVAINSRGNP